MWNARNAVLAGLCLLGLSGCGLFGGGPRDVSYARPLPAGLVQGATLDVQVYRNDTRLELTNTTARSFGPSTVWINERFSLPIDGFAIGESLDLKLRSFVDEFGNPFRAGGFFATEVPDLVVLAQLEHEGELLGLVVTGNDVQ
ncbi:MAG: hypothetical protein AAGI17_03040 [Planctomycetota bacterium]